MHKKVLVVSSFSIFVLIYGMASAQSNLLAVGTAPARGVPPPLGGPPPDIAALGANPNWEIDEYISSDHLLSSAEMHEFHITPSFLLSNPEPLPPKTSPTAPKVITSMTVDGVRYDCVARNSQAGLIGLPAPEASGKTGTNDLDTPPTIGDATPSSSPPVPTESGTTSKTGTIPKCPDNTVPIQHDVETGSSPMLDYTDKDHSVTEFNSSLNGPPTPQEELPHRYAHAAADIDFVHGMTADLSVWDPKVIPYDMTLSQTWIVAYLPNGRPQTVESGWQVWHGWGTDEAVPFIYFTSDGYQGPASKGCYNVSNDCNSFVLNSPDIILGRPIFQQNKPGHVPQTLKIVWFLKPNGNWWLQMNGVWLGYYPKAAFAGGPLPEGGQRIDVGGEATGWQPTSEMGSAHYPEEGDSVTGYVTNLGYYDKSAKLVSLTISGNPLDPSMSDPACYTAMFDKSPSISGAHGLTFLFGGPGVNYFHTDTTIQPTTTNAGLQSCVGPSAKLPGK